MPDGSHSLAAAGIVLVWLIFWFKARRLARVIDRCEVTVLKPLWIALTLLAVFHLLHAAWLVAGVFVVLVVLCGALGGRLHLDQTNSELSTGTIHRMEKGPLREPDDVEAHQTWKLCGAASTMVAIAVATTLVHEGFRVLSAIGLALAAAILFLLFSMVIVVYQK